MRASPGAPVGERGAHRVGAGASPASSTSTARGPGKKPAALAPRRSSAAGSRRRSAPAIRVSRISAAPSGPISASTSAARFSATRIGVGAVEQHAGGARVGPREPARRLAPGELHGAQSAGGAAPAAARSGRRAVAPAAARRRCSAARLAKAEAVSRVGRAVAGDRAHLAASTGAPPAERHQPEVGGADHVEAGGDVLLGQRHAGAGRARGRPRAGGSARRPARAARSAARGARSPAAPSSDPTSTRPGHAAAGAPGA